MPFNAEGKWFPNVKQEPFLALPDTLFEGLYGGGNGSGKSEVLLMYGIARRWHENPRFKQVFMRRTFPELKSEIVPRSRDFYTKFGATFNKTDMVWTFPRPDQIGSGFSNAGAMIFFGHCENDDDAHKYDSMEINLFTPDELTSFSEFIYLHIAFTRVRTNDPNLPAIVRAAGMPGGIGHGWTKRRFVAPYPEGGKIIYGKAGVKRIYIHATVADNPHADPEYAKRLDAIPNEAERKARKFGDWDSYQGQVFDEFRDRKYPDEPDNALHVIESFEIPSWWPRMIIGDWGFAAMTYIGFYAISPTGRLYLYKEMSFIKTQIAEWAPGVKAIIAQENPVVVKFCQSAGQQKGQAHTVQTEIEAELGIPIELTVNSAGTRVSGKMMVHEYLRWRAKPVIPPNEMPDYNEEYALWLQRNRPESDYKAYLQLFEPPEPETNIPKLQIFCCNSREHEGHPNCCPLMIDAVRACSYDKPKDDKPAEDVAEFAGDDPYDDLRYAVDSAEAYVREAGTRFRQVQKQQQLLELLNKNQDYTAFYRNMRQIEKGGQGSFKVVRLYGRRRH